MNWKSSRWLPLALFLLLSFSAAAIGAIATSSGVHTWYPSIAKPSWTPPNWLFAPVWALLYIAMAIAGWRVWRQGSPIEARHTFRLFGAQLALNALWSILFFALHDIGWALIDVLVLWFVLVRLLARFLAADRIAAWLWTPYVLWVTFATLLNAAVWELNR